MPGMGNNEWRVTYVVHGNRNDKKKWMKKAILIDQNWSEIDLAVPHFILSSNSILSNFGRFGLCADSEQH